MPERQQRQAMSLSAVPCTNHLLVFDFFSKEVRLRKKIDRLLGCAADGFEPAVGASKYDF